MCGIYGCLTKNKSVATHVYDGLSMLKNRGYDSCGIFLTNTNIDISYNYEFIYKIGIDGFNITEYPRRDIFDILNEKLTNIRSCVFYNLGFGHTRWATHGPKTDNNSHPHESNSKQFIIVHNGIVSNYNILKEKYLSNYKFYSNTDTEVIVNMIEELYKNTTEENSNIKNITFIDLLVDLTTNYLEGTWACLIYNKKEPHRLYFIKNGCPLIIGKNENIIILTSEPSGFRNMVSDYILLDDQNVGFVEDNCETVFTSGKYKKYILYPIDESDYILEQKYSYWLLKEIEEQQKLKVLIDPLTNKKRLEINLLNYEKNLNKLLFEKKDIFILGCGSSYYAGLLTENYFRNLNIFRYIRVIDAGEFDESYIKNIDNKDELLVLCISQSGETRDLIVAHNILEKHKIHTVGIINVIGSLLSTKTNFNIYTNCGKENSVASTKSFTSQVIVCLLFGLWKKIYNENHLNMSNTSLSLLNYENDFITLKKDIQILIDNKKNLCFYYAEQICNNGLKSMFLLGKDDLHAVALEGALKIKEVSYFHAEGFSLTSLKHGPYSLIEYNTPIIVIYRTKNHSVKSVLEEIKTRGAYVIEISCKHDNTHDTNNNVISVPNSTMFYPILSTIIIQLIAYYMSVIQGINPDTPRNLAKVVTVD
jgi:glucosamine--fructose-6-phosphate aminotransferase (isomerizing)